MRRRIFAVLIASLLALGAVAQDVAWRTTGLPPSAPGGARQLGFRVRVMDDVDLDGHGEILAEVRAGAGSVVGSPLWILSGRTGALLMESARNGPEYVRSFDRAGDWNGDGRGDFLVGLVDFNSTHSVEIRSGYDNSLLLWVPTFWPDEVIGGLDVDGDGLPDFVVVDEHSNNYFGWIDVYNHYGQLLYRLAGSMGGGGVPALGIGTSICALGDVDGDGCDDFVMGCVETSGRGVNVVVSGRTGAYLHYCYGELPGDGLFGSLERCGDIDGDGIDDFVAGSYDIATRRCARVFSGLTGAALLGWSMTAQRSIWQVSGHGCDLDGDAIPDWVVGTDEVVSPQQSGKVYAFSGRDGSLLHEIRSQGGFGRIGQSASALPAAPGEHTGLLMVPDREGPVIQNCCTLGSVTAYRGLPRTAQLLGAACSGTLSVTPNIGMQSLGATGVRVHVSDAPAGAPAMLLLGLSTTQIFSTPLPLALDPLGFPGCVLLTSIDATRMMLTGTGGVAAGYASIDVPLAVPSSGLGAFTVSGQWLVLGLGTEFPGGLTQAVTWRR